MIRKVIDYVKNEDFEVKLNNKYIDIINYTNINYMEDNKISINYIEGTLIIKGNNLTVIKLLDNEILIKGNIISINLKDLYE